MKDQYVQQVQQAVHYVKQSTDSSFHPRIALTLGSGLGKLARLIKPITSILYKTIPHFPQTTVPGHEGVLIAGYLEGIPVLGFKGRKHFYEVADQPHPMDLVTFYVHVAASLGCKTLITTNAAGGLNSDFKVGDLMVITSHIGMFLPNPLLGPHHDFSTNSYFQPQNDLYTKKLREQFLSLSADIRRGVLVSLTGRTFETQAESLMLRTLGADAVGMSTIPEMIVAANRGLETLGISIITNVIAKDGTNATSHEEVTKILNSAQTEEKLLTVFRRFFSQLV